MGCCTLSLSPAASGPSWILQERGSNAGRGSWAHPSSQAVTSQHAGEVFVVAEQDQADQLGNGLTEATRGG